MAGTLTISTLSDGTSSTSATNCIKGSAKAWCNYDGITNAIRGSYNVTSVTKNGTGDYTFNYTNAFANANYSIVCSINRDYDGSGVYGMGGYPTTRTTTNSKIFALFATGGFYDQEYVGISVFSN